MNEEPAEAYLVLHDGERIDCLIEKVDAKTWQATPVRMTAMSEVQSAHVDVIPPKASFSFVFEEEADEQT